MSETKTLGQILWEAWQKCHAKLTDEEKERYRKESLRFWGTPPSGLR
jgi:hypothetical protein